MLISVVFTIFVLTLHFRGPKTKPVPKWIKKLIIGRLGKALCFFNKKHLQVSDFEKENIYLKSNELSDSLETALVNTLKSFDLNKLQNKRLKVMILKELLGCQFNLIEKKVQMLKENIYDEWKLLAMIIDRLCFFIYLFALLMSSILFFS